MKHFSYLLLIAVYLVSCHNSSAPAPVEPQKTADDVPVIDYKVVQKLPHDTNSFTEGFLVHDNQLFESTGSPQELPATKSVLGNIDPKTGKILKKAEIDRNTYFGEGIIFINGEVFQLTYKNQICFVYDAKTYKKLKQFTYGNKEGWGLTTDGKYIIMSDGTYMLSYIDPSNFKVVKTLQVSANGFAVDNVNELEYIKGFIYANVWPTNRIIKIDPSNGHVVGKMDLTPLKEEALQKYPRSLETNGIAYDSIANKMYVTGKLWPTIYQIDIAN